MKVPSSYFKQQLAVILDITVAYIILFRKSMISDFEQF